MKIVLMGTGPFAVPSFEKIASAGHEILGVVARPPVPSAGKAPPESPVVVWARANGFSITTPDSINAADTVAWLRGLHADLFVVCDYGQILSKEAIGTVRCGGINLHGSLLPRHRGAAPVQWSILSGDTHAGVSVIHMTPHLDAGPVLVRAVTPIEDHEDAGQLEQRLSQLGVAPTLEAIAMLAESDSPSSLLQDPAHATKAPRLKKTDGQLNCRYPTSWIDRQIRGLQPWPGVYANLLLPDGKSMRLIVHRARPIPAIATWNDHEPIAPGMLLYGNTIESLRSTVAVSVTKEGGDFASGGCVLAVATIDGYLGIEILQLAGKKAMTADEFLRGYGRHASLRLETPDATHPLLEKMIGLQPAFAIEPVSQSATKSAKCSTTSTERSKPQ
ncbi:MAG: methionyl-tRNA formyltransferase [Planctomycetes bacterium]|nr:methionyl-tRNA formyltransferase [Planctomycetota bacterium]